MVTTPTNIGDVQHLGNKRSARTDTNPACSIGYDYHGPTNHKSKVTLGNKRTRLQLQTYPNIPQVATINTTSKVITPTASDVSTDPNHSQYMLGYDTSKR